jgi:hypothetical protein
MSRLKMETPRVVGVLVAVGVLAMTMGVQGETLPDGSSQREIFVVLSSATPRTFGTASLTAHVIEASQFETESDTSSWAYTASVSKFGALSMRAGVRLPAGALVSRVELEACDTDGGAQLRFGLQRRPSPGGPVEFVTPTGLTGVPDTPGCGFFSVDVLPATSPLVIDNENNTYIAFVAAPSALAAFNAVRIYYTLQVSPAPAVATFADVPAGHPFFRFVQALVAAGVTSGCGGGRFCVDDPITRGQMAVFLAIALGLHFAP